MKRRKQLSTVIIVMSMYGVHHRQRNNLAMFEYIESFFIVVLFFLQMHQIHQIVWCNVEYFSSKTDSHSETNYKSSHTHTGFTKPRRNTHVKHLLIRSLSNPPTKPIIIINERAASAVVVHRKCLHSIASKINF